MTLIRHGCRGAAAALCVLLVSCAGEPERSQLPPQPAFGPGLSTTSSRNLLEVQEVFDRNASALLALYLKRGHENPSLGAGKVVISLGIAPDGSVSHCEIVTSSFGDPEFEQRLLKRITQFNFGTRDVPPFEAPHYPIQFRPM